MRRVTGMDERIGNGDGADGVVGEGRARMEEWFEILRAMVVEFVDRTDDVADDGTKHGWIPFPWQLDQSQAPDDTTTQHSIPV